jgi:hypothetical protein
LSAKKKKNRQLSIEQIILVLFLVLAAFLAFIIIIPVESTFSISVNTERIEFIVLKDNSKIPLRNVTIFNYRGDRIDTTYQKLVQSKQDSTAGYDGTFKIAKDAVIIIERIAMGNLSIQIEGSKGQSAGTFYSWEEDEVIDEADNFVEFYIEDIKARVLKGETIIIPIKGRKIGIGRSVNYETFESTTAILKKGKVRVIGKSFFLKNNYISDTYELNIGDQFLVVGDDETEAYGFVTINENSAMDTSYKILGKKGRIITPGPINENSGYLISTSTLSRYKNDPIIIATSLVLALLVSLANIFPRVFNKTKAIDSNKSGKKRKK